jgi:hypothetical protein
MIITLWSGHLHRFGLIWRTKRVNFLTLFFDLSSAFTLRTLERPYSISESNRSCEFSHKMMLRILNFRIRETVSVSERNDVEYLVFWIDNEKQVVPSKLFEEG